MKRRQKAGFLSPRSSKITVTKEKERRRRKKAMVALLVFIIATLEFLADNKSIIPSTDMIQLTLTLKMTTAQVVKTSVTVNNNSPMQDYIHLDDQT